MSSTYLPWRVRDNRPKTKGQRRIADFAQRIHRLFSPFIQRFPGAIFTGCLVGAILLAAVGGVVFVQVGRLHNHFQWTGAEAPRWLSLAEISAATSADPALGGGVPTVVLWVFQSLLLRDLLALGAIVAFASVLVMFAIWWERKVSGFIQSRMGPMRVGGWHGWSQSLADGIKLLGKEDLIPSGADRSLFRFAPYICFVPALAAYLALPFGVYWVFRDLDVALLMILAMLGLQVVGVLLAGWASNNKWSVYGAMREACQVVSYEIPMTMALLVPIMVVGSLRLNTVVAAQSGGWFNWLAWHSPWTFIAMIIYFIASLAACKRAPFDLPEAESELVAGYHTEYSGFRWSLFFFAEYVSMFVVSGLLTILFLGGWDAPWALAAQRPEDPLFAWAQSPSWIAQLAYGALISGPLWFVAKCLLLIFVQMWLRWTLPRLRIDQVLYSCIQVIVPLMFVVLLAAAVWEWLLNPATSPSALPRGGTLFVVASNLISLALASIGLLGAFGAVVVALGGFRRGRELVGSLGVERPLKGG